MSFEFAGEKSTLLGSSKYAALRRPRLVLLLVAILSAIKHLGLWRRTLESSSYAATRGHRNEPWCTKTYVPDRKVGWTENSVDCSRVETGLTERMAFVSLFMWEFRFIFSEEDGGFTNSPGSRSVVSHMSWASVCPVSGFTSSWLPSNTSGSASIHCETFAADRGDLIHRWVFYQPVCSWVVGSRSESCDS